MGLATSHVAPLGDNPVQWMAHDVNQLQLGKMAVHEFSGMSELLLPAGIHRAAFPTQAGVSALGKE